MDGKTRMELDALRVRLSDGIGAISVIVDGLTLYTSGSTLSGENAMRYVNTLSAVYDTLEAIAGEFEAKLDAAKPVSKENEGAA